MSVSNTWFGVARDFVPLLEGGRVSEKCLGVSTLQSLQNLMNINHFIKMIIHHWRTVKMWRLLPSGLLVEARAHLRQALLKMELLPQELAVGVPPSMLTEEENLCRSLLLFIEVSRVETVIGLSWPPAGRVEATAAKLGFVREVKLDMLCQDEYRMKSKLQCFHVIIL